jgi:hypothetical protein
MLKGQDIALIIRLLLNIETRQSVEHLKLAYKLHISQSEVSKSFIRLEKVNLVSRYSNKSLQIHKHELYEMLTHGLRYFMEAELNLPQRGIITAYSFPSIKKELVSEEDYIWPYIEGEARGISISPLYKTLPHALYRAPDPVFHEMMSAIDLLRIGESRGVKVAKKILEKRIWG